MNGKNIIQLYTSRRFAENVASMIAFVNNRATSSYGGPGMEVSFPKDGVQILLLALSCCMEETREHVAVHWQPPRV